MWDTAPRPQCHQLLSCATIHCRASCPWDRGTAKAPALLQGVQWLLCSFYGLSISPCSLEPLGWPRLLLHPDPAALCASRRRLGCVPIISYLLYQ